MYFDIVVARIQKGRAAGSLGNHAVCIVNIIKDTKIFSAVARDVVVGECCPADSFLALGMLRRVFSTEGIDGESARPAMAISHFGT